MENAPFGLYTFHIWSWTSFWARRTRSKEPSLISSFRYQLPFGYPKYTDWSSQKLAMSQSTAFFCSFPFLNTGAS